MSKKNDRSRGNRGDEYDEYYGEETPRTFRDRSFNAAYPQRPRPRSRDTSQDDTQETPDRPGNRRRSPSAPGGGRIYEESDERPSRPRPTRQSREEVYARLRQRPRQPIYSRNQDETRLGPPPQAQARKPGQPTPRRAQSEEDEYPYQQPAPRRTRDNDYDYARQLPRAPHSSARPSRRANEQYDEYEEYDEYDEYEVIQPNRRQQQRKRGRGRSVFSTLLVGCLGGLLTLIVVAAIIVFLVLHNTPLGSNLGIGKATYTQQNQQALALGHATQLIIRNQAGNVSVSVAQNASSATVASVKRVQAGSQDDANGQFRQITLTTKQIGQGADPACTASSCLLITTTLPAASGGSLLGSGNGDSIDLTVTLPASFSSPFSPYTLAVNANAGNITVNGFNGILNLSGSAGNMSINHALIYAGTCIQTTHGNITVAQGSFFDLDQSSKLVPCSTTISTGAHPWFNIRSGVGNVDITLLTNSTNILLDANTNDGKISDDFGLNIPGSSDGSASYHGPLLSNTNPTASLYVATSTGNITLHRQ